MKLAPPNLHSPFVIRRGIRPRGISIGTSPLDFAHKRSIDNPRAMRKDVDWSSYIDNFFDKYIVLSCIWQKKLAPFSSLMKFKPLTEWLAFTTNPDTTRSMSNGPLVHLNLCCSIVVFAQLVGLNVIYCFNICMCPPYMTASFGFHHVSFFNLLSTVILILQNEIKNEISK